MASRTSTDPLEILVEMGVDLDNLSEEEDYLSALMEAVNTLQIKNAGDVRIGPLQQEIRKVRQKRKAADPKFKARKTKISANSFKKGSATGSNVAPKALPTSALVPYQAPEAEEKKEEKKKGSPKNLILEISETVTRIADILKEQYDLKKDTATFDRKKAERERRDLQKKNLAKRFEGLKKVAQKIIAPVKGIFDRIMGFLFNIILGKFLMKLVDWFSNPDNKSKINSIIRFLSNNWPKLLSAYIIFGTGLGKFSRFIVKILARGAIRLAAATAGLLARLFGGRALGKFSRFLGKRGKLIAGGIEAVTTIFAFKALEGAFTKGLGPEESAGVDNDIPVSGYRGGGLVQPIFKFSGGGKVSGGNLNLNLISPMGYNEGGEVAGPSGTDTIPAMLTDGEFVMSRGAVQKFGVSQLEAMNASGGGTNKPKMMNGTVYASDGGRIGSRVGPRDPESYQRTPDVMAMMEAFLAEAGKRLPWAAKIVDPSFYSRSLNEAGKFIPNIDTDFVPRALNEAGKFIPNIDTDFVPRAIEEGMKMASPTLERAMNVGREGKKIIESTIAGVVDKDYGGMLNQARNMYGAAEEAVPALIGGILGNDRIDRHISKDMQKAILDAKKTAEARGSKNIDYGDYEGGGQSAAGLTMGRVGDNEFKRDAQGRIVGLTQTFDTNRPAEEAMLQSQISATRFLGMDNTGAINKLKKLMTTRMKSEGASPEEIKKAVSGLKPGGDAGNLKDLTRSIYKPFEALLDTVQGRGTTTHDVMFDKDVLGFDPVEAPPKPGSPNYQLFKDGGGMAAMSQGKTVRQVVDAGRGANTTNPIMDFLGLSKPKPDEKPKETVGAKGYFSNTTGKFYISYAEALKDPQVAAAAKVEETKKKFSFAPNQQPNLTIPGMPTTGSNGSNVTVVKTSSKDKSPSGNTGGSEVPNANPGQGNRGKWNILGMSVPALF